MYNLGSRDIYVGTCKGIIFAKCSSMYNINNMCINIYIINQQHFCVYTTCVLASLPTSMHAHTQTHADTHARTHTHTDTHTHTHSSISRPHTRTHAQSVIVRQAGAACSELQGVAVSSSEWQWVAVSGSALQFVAVRGSLLQWHREESRSYWTWHVRIVTESIRVAVRVAVSCNELQ